MVLTYLEIDISYQKLLNLLETRWFGTPFQNLERLEQLGVRVSIEHLGIDGILPHLTVGVPVIAGVHTAALGYWELAVDHVVVVIGADEAYIYVHDPSLEQGALPVPLAAFGLAQLEFDNLCAIIRG